MLPHIGSAAARRGDVIRCTVMFENEQEREGKVQVPVVFTVNGSRIILEGNGEVYIDYSPDKPLYPYVAFKYANTVMAKVKITITMDWSNLLSNNEIGHSRCTHMKCAFE